MPTELNLKYFREKDYISRDELIHFIKEQTNYTKDSSTRWMIHQLIQRGEITQINSRYFYKGILKEYMPSNSSDTKKKIELILKSKYPSLEIVIWESTIFNEWLNHQISRNNIFVEVEKYYMENVFNTIRENIGNRVLYNPSLDDYYLYAEEDIVIVTNLISRSPRHHSSFEIKIEKLIVDIFSNDLISEFVSQSEYSSIISQMFHLYKINSDTIITYAKRRNIDSKILKYIKKHMPKKDEVHD